MQFTLCLVLLGVGYAMSESCTTSSSCVHTHCDPSATDHKVECESGQCHCVTPHTCSSQSDCAQYGACGLRNDWHCRDSLCSCRFGSLPGIGSCPSGNFLQCLGQVGK